MILLRLEVLVAAIHSHRKFFFYIKYIYENVKLDS